jgi:hypothetical protein
MAGIGTSGFAGRGVMVEPIRTGMTRKRRERHNERFNERRRNAG